MAQAPKQSNESERGDFTTSPRVLILTAMAAVIGVISAFVAVALVWLIAVITNAAYYHRFSSVMVSPAANRLGWWAVLVPVVGGLVIGLVARFGSEKIRGHGIPEAMEAILIGQSRLSAKVAVLKPLASAISIGTGGPFGAEGPIIMTGGAFGSLFAQAFHLSASERKTLLVAGAAGGMAAIFATPLAAVLLAVELLLFEWKPRSFIPVATASAVAATLRIPLLGSGPLFFVTPHGQLSALALAACVAVGVLAGVGSSLLTGLVYAWEDLFAKLPIHWMWWPMIGGLAIGIGGLIEPRALGVGYDTIRDLFAGHLIGTVLLVLLVTKALMWAIALGSGTSGGVLAPLLIMGGALGGLEAGVVHASDPGLWAMISMAAMMGGTMRSPLTAIAFLLELTGDIAILPGLLIACVAAHTVTVLLMRRSILTEKVARHGHHVMREYAVSPFARFRVDDVMHTQPAGVTVVAAGGVPPIVAYPDELLEEAMATMLAAGIKQLPVVNRDDPERQVGVLDGTAIAAVWSELHDEEHVRGASPLAVRLRQLGRTLLKRAS